MQGGTMAMRRQGLGLCLTALVVFGGLGASAQYPIGGPLTVGPFVGYRFGGELKDSGTGNSVDLESGPAYGLVFNWGFPETLAGTTRQIEFLWSYQDADLDADDAGYRGRDLNIDVHYFQVGGMLQWDTEHVEPFVSGGLGATYLRPDWDNGGDDLNFSVNLGGGLKYWFSRNVGLRADGRGYMTLVNGDRIFGDPDIPGSLMIGYDGDTFWQFEATGALVIRF